MQKASPTAPASLVSRKSSSALDVGGGVRTRDPAVLAIISGQGGWSVPWVGRGRGGTDEGSRGAGDHLRARWVVCPLGGEGAGGGYGRGTPPCWRSSQGKVGGLSPGVGMIDVIRHVCHVGARKAYVGHVSNPNRCVISVSMTVCR